MASENHLGENPAPAQGLCSGNSTPPTKLPTVNTLPKGITMRNKAARSPGHQGRAAPPAVSSSASVHQALQPIGLVPAGPSASSEVGMAVLCRAWRGGQEGRLGRRSCSYGRNHGNPGNTTASRSWKRQERSLPWGAQKSQPVRHLDFSPVRLIFYFWPPQLQENKLLFSRSHCVCGNLLQEQ